MSDDKEQPPHAGSERRRGPRRKKNERREMVRFEPDKTPRRSGKDRRKSKDLWKDRDKF
jgi:hypothetical protein